MIETLHIVLPGLFHTMGKDESENECYPSLFKLLTKATMIPDRPASFEGVLKQYFSGLPCREIPAGALSALVWDLTKLSDTSTWIRADPVYLKTDAHGVYCLGNQHLQIEPDESHAIITSLNEYFKDEGLALFPGSSQSWVMKCDSPSKMATNTLADVEGRSIDRLLPSGPDALAWHKRLAECQLILNQHPVNLARQEKGMLPINSLWFWGIGSLPSGIVSVFDSMYSDNKMMQGLGLLSNTPCYRDLKMFDNYYDKILANGHQHCAIIDSRIKRAANLTQMDLRKQLLSYYETHWFAPISQALLDGKIKSVYVDACDGRRFLVSKRHFKYFWRKNQNLMSYNS